MKPLETSRFLDRITDAVPCMIYVYDIAGRRNLYINSHVSLMLGFTPEQIVGLHPSVRDMFHPDDMNEIRAMLRKLGGVDDGGAVVVECRMRHALGEWRWVRSRNLIFERGADGRPAKIIGAAVDITEQKLAEQRVAELDARLENASKLTLMGATLASIAHELHQPLAAIANYAGGCARVLSSAGPTMRMAPGEIVDKIRRISDEALRAGGIIKRLQSLLRMHEPRRAQVDVRTVVGDASDVTESLLRRGEIALEKSIDADVPAIYADGVQLTQVLVNLLMNAADACGGVEPERRKIEIRARREGAAEVEISVTDHAGALDPELAPRVFDQFFTTGRGGLGMGLAICRSIVESHGGRIAAAVTPGRATTVRFQIPV